MDKRGFTLIEILVYVGIVSALLVSVTVFFGSSNEARVKSSVIGTVNDQGTYAMDYITSTIRNATAISQLTSTTLSMTVPTTANSPTKFALSGSNLTVQKGTGSIIAITSPAVAVSGLTFTNVTRTGTNGIVKVSFTIASSNTTGRAEYSYSRTFTSSAEVSW